MPGDGRILPLCWRGIRSRVVALLRLARPLGTFGRQGVLQRAFSVRLQGLVEDVGFAKKPHLQSPARAAFLSLRGEESTPRQFL